MRWLGLIGSLVLAATCFPASEIHLRPGESIQEAIETAPAGSVIVLPPGLWRENLTIQEEISLRGAEAAQTVIAPATPGSPVITIASSQTISVTLEALTVAGGTGGCQGAWCPHGILVTGSARLTLVSCEIRGNAACGLFVSGEAEVTASETSFLENQAGVWVHGQAQVTLQGCDLQGNSYGLIVTGLGRVTAQESLISNNLEDGVLVADGGRVYLWDNEISQNGRVGVCIDLPGCYRTQRSFTGLVRGEDNTVPESDQPDANGLAPFCPAELAFLRLRLGGIFPPPDPEALLARLPLPLPPLGSPEAPVAILEFSDFSCPYCARFTLETLPQLEEEYIGPGLVKLFFFPYPLHGEGARLGAQAAFCALSQGLFWEFQEAAFRYMEEHGFPELGERELMDIMASVGGDHQELSQCLATARWARAVEECIAIGRELGVRGTPTFFLGGWVVPGAYPYPVFQGILNWLLNRSSGG